MPDTTPVTGLHTPITNIAPTESTVMGHMLSPGSVGFGDEDGVDEDSPIESIGQRELESALEAGLEFTAPDLSGLDDIGVASYGAPPQLETVLGSDERKLVTNTRQMSP